MKKEMITAVTRFCKRSQLWVVKVAATKRSPETTVRVAMAIKTVPGCIFAAIDATRIDSPAVHKNSSMQFFGTDLRALSSQIKITNGTKKRMTPRPSTVGSLKKWPSVVDAELARVSKKVMDI